MTEAQCTEKHLFIPFSHECVIFSYKVFFFWFTDLFLLIIYYTCVVPNVVMLYYNTKGHSK